MGAVGAPERTIGGVVRSVSNDFWRVLCDRLFLIVPKTLGYHTIGLWVCPVSHTAVCLVKLRTARSPPFFYVLCSSPSVLSLFRRFLLCTRLYSFLYFSSLIP